MGEEKRDKKEIAVRSDGTLAGLNKQKLFRSAQCVNYSLIDSSKYQFEYTVDDETDVFMYESDRTFDSDELLEAEFAEEGDESNKPYYMLALSSGILTGALSLLKLSDGSFKKVKEWTGEWDDFLLGIAKTLGFKKKDVKGAVSYLKDRFVNSIKEELEEEVQDGLDQWINLLSSHPSVAGLIFSILTQISGERFFFDDKKIKTQKVPEYYAIGRNTEEKILYGVLYWFYYIVEDSFVSRLNILNDMKIPSHVIKLIKELCSLPIFKNNHSSFWDTEKCYSELIRRIVEKSHVYKENGDCEEFDLKKEINDLKQKKQLNTTPIIINECIVRAFYVTKKLIKEIRDKDIKTISNISEISVENVIPFNNRLICRMVLISSGCFMGVNIAGATIKAIREAVKNGKKFSETLVTEINIAGIGRFVFACIADSKYWAEDIRILLQRKEKKQQTSTEEEKVAGELLDNDVYQTFSLNPAFSQLLFSLQCVAVMKDIEHAETQEEKKAKRQWLELWKSKIMDGMDRSKASYFETDEDKIYSAVNSLKQTKENLRQFYLVAMELTVFKPYHPLGVEKDIQFKKLHREKYNYIDDQFVRRQTVLNQAEIDSIRESYKKYKNYINGRTQRLIITSGVTAATAVVTGGLAFAFAPGIATMIAGEAVVGLHGAALTSASLAFVGGGSLAVGGLGMAGGTMIITGGGALLGLAGSGGISMTALLSQTTSDYWLRQATKMLVFCKCILKDRFNDLDAIKTLSKEIDKTRIDMESKIESLKKEDCTLDNEMIKSSEKGMKYLERCKKEMDNMTQ